MSDNQELHLRSHLYVALKDDWNEGGNRNGNIGRLLTLLAEKYTEIANKLIPFLL